MFVFGTGAEVADIKELVLGSKGALLFTLSHGLDGVYRVLMGLAA